MSEPTMNDAKKYCPMNSKSRGDNQLSLVEDYNEGLCDLDHERCQYKTCSILKETIKEYDMRGFR
jgi:hypothetical protein